MSERSKLPVLGQTDAPLAMDRRQALKVMAIAAAVPGLASCAPSEGGGDAASTASLASNPKAAGTAWDPDLLASVVPWERVLTSDELDTLATLCDVIIPADDRSSSASQLGAHDFIDEWVSAPYARNERDQVTVRGGLLWLDRESTARFGEGSRFRDLDDAQQRAICDDICYAPDTPSNLEAGARFFDRVRDLTAAAFYTTREGMQDIEYVGNVPLARWDPPPPEVLRHLGLE
jgi:gluconate 2-dehydrogenase gamma chain